jgi:hypothetical protein
MRNFPSTAEVSIQGLAVSAHQIANRPIERRLIHLGLLRGPAGTMQGLEALDASGLIFR